MQSSLPPSVVDCVPVNKQPPSSGGERTPFGESVREKGFERELLALAGSQAWVLPKIILVPGCIPIPLLYIHSIRSS